MSCSWVTRHSITLQSLQTSETKQMWENLRLSWSRGIGSAWANGWHVPSINYCWAAGLLLWVRVIGLLVLLLRASAEHGGGAHHSPLRAEAAGAEGLPVRARMRHSFRSLLAGLLQCWLLFHGEKWFLLLCFPAPSFLVDDTGDWRRDYKYIRSEFETP